MAGRLEGKVCVITGAASGIGAESARLFASGGRAASSASTSIEGAEGEVAIEADVTDEEQVRRDVRARPRASSGASTCSSTTPASTRPTTRSVLETELEAWQRVQDVNLRSVFLCCKHGIPHLLETGGGSVINTASFVAVMGAAVSQISYTASKGGVLALSRELGVEFARRGVRVNALCPGPSTRRCFRTCSPSDPEKAARRLVHLPMGRFAEPEEIAQAAAFLAARRVAPTSPPRPSSSTAASPAPTSRRRRASSLSAIDANSLSPDSYRGVGISGQGVKADEERPRVLVVDDEPPMRTALTRALELGGFEVSLAANGEEGLGGARSLAPDLIVLDVMMPRLDGIEVCRRLRDRGDRTPVLMLTARDAVADRVDGLEAGADDYLVKPFALEELLARMRALLRRTGIAERRRSR